MEAKEQNEPKGKTNATQNSSKAQINNEAKVKEKGYKDKTKLSSEELERYRKDNKCFSVGSKVMFHMYVLREVNVMTLVEPLHLPSSPQFFLLAV